MGSLSLLQGIFPTQRSNPGLPHCRQILYQQSHKGTKNAKQTYQTRVVVIIAKIAAVKTPSSGSMVKTGPKHSTTRSNGI